VSLTHSDAAANALLDAVLNLINGGTTNPAGRIRFRDGAGPGTTNADTGTLLATLTLSNPAFAAAATRAKVLNGTPLSTTVLASGTLGHYRFEDRDGTAVQEGAIAISGSDINFAGGVTVLLGGTLTISAYLVNAPP
jgi:hypothetical protein